MGLHGGGIQVGHESAFQVGEFPQHVHRLFIEEPGHPVGIGAVKPGMGGKQAEGRPALVYVSRGGALKAADIVAPEAEAGEAQGKPGPQGFAHGGVVGGAVAAPVYREFLAAYRGAAGKEAGPVFALVFLQKLKDALVIQIGIIVVHQLRVAAVIIDHVGGNALAEVGFEAVHTHLQQGAELFLIPFPGGGVGKVHQAHAGLPQVPLPHIAVRTL